MLLVSAIEVFRMLVVNYTGVVLTLMSLVEPVDLGLIEELVIMCL